MIASVSQRGLKRTCQDDACGVRFYDLNKAKIACPVCGAAFTAPPPQAPREVTVKQVTPRRPYSKPFGAPGRPVAVSPPLEAAAGDVDEIVDEVADEVDEISVEVDDAVDEKTESILELDDEVEDVEPVVPNDKDSE
jgi:hypothetical protein